MQEIFFPFFFFFAGFEKTILTWPWESACLRKQWGKILLKQTKKGRCYFFSSPRTETREFASFSPTLFILSWIPLIRLHLHFLSLLTLILPRLFAKHLSYIWCHFFKLPHYPLTTCHFVTLLHALDFKLPYAHFITATNLFLFVVMLERPVEIKS